MEEKDYWIKEIQDWIKYGARRGLHTAVLYLRKERFERNFNRQYIFGMQYLEKEQVFDNSQGQKICEFDCSKSIHEQKAWEDLVQQLPQLLSK
jgi:hypothetical protein